MLRRSDESMRAAHSIAFPRKVGGPPRTWGTFDVGLHRNVQPTLLMTAAQVNTEQLLNFRKIIVTNDGLAQLAERLAK